MHFNITIVGAGPAGSMAAYKLAKGGKKVILFDHRAPWEKPCGGMIGPGTIEKHPIMLKYSYPKTIHNGINLISPRSDKTFIASSQPFPAVSRLELGKFLINQAEKAGAAFLRQKVLAISRDGLKWNIETEQGSYMSELIIGADGAGSIVRKTIIGKIPGKYLLRACGFFMDGISEKQYTAKYLDIHGFIWFVSRPHDSSAGIIARLGTLSSKDFFNKLDEFLQENYPGAKPINKWTAFIPIINDPAFFELPCCGDNWLLIGDAAGHVDPISGGGIAYALKSAELASLSILKGNPSLYEIGWRESYGKTLSKKAAKMQHLTSLAAQFGPEMAAAFMYNYSVHGSFL
ncbi:MAG TPA: hypothetical protein ENI15_13810 [Spirochaetes bacterium]|nr:hypothetical protein [Spirochaetota bacterium]